MPFGSGCAIQQPMNMAHLETKNLILVPQTRDEIRAMINALPPHERAEVSPAWLALMEGTDLVVPWVHGFKLVHRTCDNVVGKCGFKGPPDADGMVEIAYGVNAEHEGKGYATEAAGALVNYAFSHAEVHLVRAHTMLRDNASARVLTKSHFQSIGEVSDPEDGLVWRWERKNRIPSQAEHI